MSGDRRHIRSTRRTRSSRRRRVLVAARSPSFGCPVRTRTRLRDAIDRSMARARRGRRRSATVRDASGHGARSVDRAFATTRRPRSRAKTPSRSSRMVDSSCRRRSSARSIARGARAGAARRIHATRGAQRQARHSSGRSDGRSGRARARARRSGVALRQLDGGLSRRVLALRDELIGLEALIAYDIDFPEEDDGPIAPARIERATDERDRRARATARDGAGRRARSRRRARRARRCAERRQVVAVQRAARRESRDRHGHSRHDSRRDRSGDRHADASAAARRHGGTARCARSGRANRRRGERVATSRARPSCSRAPTVGDRFDALALRSAAEQPRADRSSCWTKSDLRPPTRAELAAMRVDDRRRARGVGERRNRTRAATS